MAAPMMRETLSAWAPVSASGGTAGSGAAAAGFGDWALAGTATALAIAIASARERCTRSLLVRRRREHLTPIGGRAGRGRAMAQFGQVWSYHAMDRRLLAIVLAQLFGTSLWFSANAAAGDLNRAWGV